MNSRVSLTLGHDLVMAALSFYIALYLRLGPGLFDLSQQIVGLGLIAFIACAAVVCLSCSACHAWFGATARWTT